MTKLSAVGGNQTKSEGSESGRNHVISHQVTSRHVMSCHVMSYNVMPRHVTSHHVMSCHVTSRHVSNIFEVSLFLKAPSSDLSFQIFLQVCTPRIHQIEWQYVEYSCRNDYS